MEDEKLNKSQIINKSSNITIDLTTTNDLEAFLQNGFKICAESTRTSNALPKDNEFNFYKTHLAFGNIMKEEGDRILTLINKIARYNEIEENIKHKTFEKKLDLCLEINDTILERVGTNIDEFNGVKQLFTPQIKMVSTALPVSGSWNNARITGKAASETLTTNKKILLFAAKNVIRPQKFFKDVIDNSFLYPWMPHITEKPNSLKPLALELEETEFGEQFRHPYEFELDRFTPSEEFLKKAEVTEPKPISATPLLEINQPEQLNELVETLRKQKVFAVDLEHHSYRTFMGITCLMQISTEDTDYIIDTLALRDKLYLLNEVFTKASILKVFHGADNDVQWLQRDLSIYVVNMFDTHKAAKQLGYSGLSLSYLLNRFCSFMPDKKFQLADWRIRPLPAELKEYAREDTHYLIYLYCILKNELLKLGNGKNNILKSVFQMSTDVCKIRYFKPTFTENSYMDFYRKHKRSFDNRQLYALKELYKWRDQLARTEDESNGYVLPNHMLLQISETLPKEVQGIYACCNPMPPLVRANSLEIHKIILRAREQPLQKPIMKESIRNANLKESTKINIDSPLHCPHDLTRQFEFRDDLPTVLARTLQPSNVFAASNLEKTASSYAVFNAANDDAVINMKVKHLHFLGPYERYKLIRPFIQEVERDSAASVKKEDNTENDPSVEQRIQSLHEHFISFKNAQTQAPSRTESATNAEQPPQEPQQEQEQEKSPSTAAEAKSRKRKAKKEIDRSKTLLELGAKKKRKRIDSDDGGWLHGEHQLPSNSLHTTLPVSHKQFKRMKYGAAAATVVTKEKIAAVDAHKKGGPPQNAKCNVNANNKPKSASNKTAKNRKNKNDQQREFTPFDYSQVNFNEFAGGAPKLTHAAVKTKFNGKKNNKLKMGGGKSNNKSMTFQSSFNKRGRGR